MLMRVWAWITAGLGLAILVIAFVSFARLENWADDNRPFAAMVPGTMLVILLGVLGLVLFVGGLAVSLAGGRRATAAPGYERRR